MSSVHSERRLGAVVKSANTHEPLWQSAEIQIGALVFALLSHFLLQSPRRFVSVKLVSSVIVCQVCGFLCPFRSDDWTRAALHLPSDADNRLGLLEKVIFMFKKNAILAPTVGLGRGVQ